MPIKTKPSSGFTLVEMLIIAPIVILFIGGFIGLLVALTGDSLKKHAQNILTSETQAALEDIETNSAKATSFLATTGTLQDKQGKGDTGGTPFTNTTAGAPDTLILSSPATTTNPFDDNRGLVYTGSSPCDTSQPIYTYTSVYFVDSSNTLYKRTILPTSSTTCATPYQKGSCSSAVMASTPPSYCQIEDDKLLENVTGFSVQYFDVDENQVAATAATAMSVTIQTSKMVAGEGLTYSGNTRTMGLSSAVTGSTRTTKSTKFSFRGVAVNGTNIGGHSCAVASGSLYCWGNNYDSELGDGTTTTTNSPGLVSGALGGKTVTAVFTTKFGDGSGSVASTCAIASGSLYCWGRNALTRAGSNLLGTGTTDAVVNVPTLIGGALAGKTVTDFSFSAVSPNSTTWYGHACAVASGSLYCWGDDYAYETGDGTSTATNTPTLVGGALAGKTVTSVFTTKYGDGSASIGSTCAIADGQLYCWGNNAINASSGFLGTGTSGGTITTPTLVGGVMAGKTVTDFSFSADAVNSTNIDGHACAVANGSLYCWGNNYSSELGDGTTTASNTPILAGGALAGKTVTSVFTKRFGDGSGSIGSTCAIASGSLYCWGRNTLYQSTEGLLGTGATQTVTTPTLVGGTMAGKTVTDFSFSAVAVNATNMAGHACAVASGSLYCWGSNASYQIGDGTATPANTPVLIAGALAGKTVTSVFTTKFGDGSVSIGSTCAIADGSLYCWGNNLINASGGFLGTGTSGGTITTPTLVSGVMAGKMVGQ